MPVTINGDTGLTTANAVFTDASGNVGIGTASPSAKLNIYDAASSFLTVEGDAGAAVISARYSTDVTDPYLILRKGRGTVSSKSAVASGDTVGSLFFQAYGGTNNRSIASIRAFVDTYTSDTNISGYLTFSTSPSGSASATERMRINSNGDVGINTVPNSFSPYKYLHVRGTSATAGGVFYTDTSDASSIGQFYSASGVVSIGSITSSVLTFVTNSVERVRIDTSGFTQFQTNNVMPYQGAITSKAAAATLTGAELITGILNTTGTTYTVTLPTGANIEGALTWVGNNVCLDWFVINTASGTITIAANGNTTLGSLTVATGTTAYFRIRRTAANTFTVYRLS